MYVVQYLLREALMHALLLKHLCLFACIKGLNFNYSLFLCQDYAIRRNGHLKHLIFSHFVGHCYSEFTRPCTWLPLMTLDNFISWACEYSKLLLVLCDFVFILNAYIAWDKFCIDNWTRVGINCLNELKLVTFSIKEMYHTVAASRDEELGIAIALLGWSERLRIL